MQALKGVVIIMSLAIAVLMTLIVYGMYQKSQNPDFKFFDLGGDEPETVTATPPLAGAPDTPVQPSQVIGQAFGNVSLGLPSGARVVSAQASGGRLVIVVARSGETADTVIVVDLGTGQVLGRVKTSP